MRSLYFILVMLVSQFVFSQSGDFQVWNSLNLKYNFNSKSNINIKQSLRTYQNSTYWRLSFTELTYAYKLNKQFKVSAGYRYAFKNTIEFVYTKQRIFADISYTKKINNFAIKFRPRIQIDIAKLNDFHTFYVNREMLELLRNINKTFSVYASTEVYFAIPSQELKPNYYGFYKYRFTGGVNIKFSNSSSLKVFYRYQYEQNSLIENSYILGITYKYEIN